MEEVEEQPPAAAAKKTSIEKKSKSDKFSHPPYFQMIKEALLGLNEKGGSSSCAIAKYMEEKHKDVLPASYKKTLGVQLKNCVATQKLIKVEAYSFKLFDASKKEIKAKAVVPKPKSVKSVAAADEKTKSRKKPTTSSSSKPKSTTAVVPKLKTSTFKKSETTTAAPKKKKTAAPAKKVAATTPTKKAGSAEEICSWYYC
ncbi:hypothetical protein MKX03_018133 [Papaver bracteatum]|nr:hypothetical protein MKX03_018133 [Papaver bracteatum]